MTGQAVGRVTTRRSLAADVSQGLGGIGHPRISLDNDRFALVDAGGNAYQWPEANLQVIIIDANPNVSKRMFQPGDPIGSGKPPLCWSDNGVAPSKFAREKQSPTCASCQYNDWDSGVSAVTGKGVKLCRDYKKLAVFVVGDTAELCYELDVPPNSLKNLKIYSKKVASFNNASGEPADLYDVCTWLWFESRGTINFHEAGWIDAEQATRIDQAWASQITDGLVGKNDPPADPTDFHPQVSGPQAAAQVQWHDNPAPTGGVVPQGSPLGQPARVEPPQQPQAEPRTAGRGGPRRGAGRPKNAPAAPAAAGIAPPQEIIPPGQSGPPFTSAPTPGAAPPFAPPAAPSFGVAPPGGGDAGPLPGFLQRGGPTNAANPAPNGSRGGFGQPAPAGGNADIASALDTAFSLGAPRG